MVKLLNQSIPTISVYTVHVWPTLRLYVDQVLVEVLELLPGWSEHHDARHVRAGPRVGPDQNTDSNTVH